MSDVDLAPLERALGLTFRNRHLLLQALVHKSYVNEHPEMRLAPNERLEFLGDAVLGAVVAHYLYERYPTAPEGDLTVLRAAMVRQSTLARWAHRLHLGDHVLLGRGEELGGGRQREALLAQAFEAVIGAVYLDQGYEAARQVLYPFLVAEPEPAAAGRALLDAKSRLQQLSQARFETVPRYRVVEVRGPGHSPVFTVEVSAGPVVLATGTGRTKQSAEQAAARAALEQFESDRSEAKS